MGIWLFRIEPGLVPERPLMRRRFRSVASMRSIVAADIEHSLARTASSRVSAPVRSRTCTISAMNGARRLPAGPFSVDHTNRKGSRSSGPYVGDRRFLEGSRSLPGPASAPVSARRAWRLVQPVSCTSSSRISVFPCFEAPS